jgi:hypothetical protein
VTERPFFGSEVIIVEDGRWDEIPVLVKFFIIVVVSHSMMCTEESVEINGFMVRDGWIVHIRHSGEEIVVDNVELG